MKQKLSRGLAAQNFSVIVFLVLFPTIVHASSQVGSSCPEKFIATVTNVEDVEAGAFPKMEINFQVIQTLKGNNVISKKIQIVKGGPIEFKSGDTYTVEFRDQWLCSAALFSKI